MICTYLCICMSILTFFGFGMLWLLHLRHFLDLSLLKGLPLILVLFALVIYRLVGLSSKSVAV